MKKLFAILMIVTMVVCYMPTVAFAGSVNTDPIDNECDLTNFGFDYITEYVEHAYGGDVSYSRNCDIKVYCAKQGGTITQVSNHWNDLCDGTACQTKEHVGYYNLIAEPDEGWVVKWEHRIGQTIVNKDGTKRETSYSPNGSIYVGTCDSKTYSNSYKKFVPLEEVNGLRINRVTNSTAEAHYVIHAHFNPTITVNYKGDGSFVDVRGGAKVEAEYKKDKVFTAKEGYEIDTVTVTDLEGKTVPDSCFTNDGGSITFKNVDKPLNVEVTFKENGDNPKPQGNNASFFLEDNGNYFPAHLDNGTLGPLVGRVEDGKVKTEPNNDQLMSTIQDYYRLSYKEMDGVHVEWNTIQDMSSHGCPYHVDGVALGENDQPLSKHDNRARITYMDETGTKVLYTDYVEKDKPIDHAGVPTPEKEGYKFDKWVLPDGSTMGGAVPVTEDLTFKATWTEDNGSGNGENASGDGCVEQKNLAYSTLVNDCDFTFYCTPGGGKIKEVHWDTYLGKRKTFPRLSGYCKFEATPSEGWVFNEWKHEISRDAIPYVSDGWRYEQYKWETGLINKKTHYAFSTNGREIELRRGPWKLETTGAKLHYVVHAHFNPKITVEYDDTKWSVTDGIGGKKVDNGVQVVVPYKTDKTFGIQTVDGKTAKIEVVDVDGKPVNTGYTKNQDGSITFNKVSQPLKLKVTEDVELPPAPKEYNASFFFHAGGNNYFPAHSFDDESKAIMGPLLGKVYGVPKTGEKVTDLIKEAPEDEKIKEAIKNYYRLTDEEMVGVKWRWNVVKGHGDEGGLECLSCPYHVDGDALDKDGNPLKIKYSMEYLVDGEHHYTARLDEGAENTHADVPTPTKPGYDFNSWNLITPKADGISVRQDLTYEATWTEKPSYDASFFIKPDGKDAPDDPNGVFPENEFLPNGDAHKALQGKVYGPATYGPATGKDAVKEAIKTEPKREDIIKVIKDAYQLDAQEELAVNFRWYVIKSVNDDCNYHVDGVPVLDKDTDNERVLKRYKITYQDDAGKVLYSTRANAGEDIPGYVGDTPTKDGYKFAGWESSSEDGKVHGHLTLTPKWEDNGNGGNTGGNGGNNGGNTGGNGGNNGDNTGGNGGNNGGNTGGNGGNNGGNTGGNGGQLPPDQNLEDPDNNGNGGNGNGEGGNGNGGNGGDSQKPLPGDKNLTDGTTDTDVPKTGDAGMDALVLNLLLLSISAMAGTVLYLRRRIAKR